MQKQKKECLDDWAVGEKQFVTAGVSHRDNRRNKRRTETYSCDTLTLATTLMGY
jgi:hypothetical protein